MKKRSVLSWLLVSCFIWSTAFAAWDKTKPVDDGLLEDFPSQCRANWEALEAGTDPALQITNAKVSATAGIVDTKLAQITTASKVSGAALTSLTSVPVGAGKLPAANVDTGTTANKIVILDGSAKLPAVDGSQLTGVVGSGSVPVGAVFAWVSNTAPTGYLLCDGSAVSRTTYASLFAVIGTVYGVGDNSTTFNLPDMRGRVAVGQDDMGGSSANRVTDADADTLGNSDGEELHTLSEAELPSHNHSFQYLGITGGDQGNAIPVWASDPSSTGATNSHYGWLTSSLWRAGYTGSGTAHQNMQPYLTLNYIIKA